MLKYDFKVDVSDKTSTGILLQRIKEKGTVLEFGSATGRMTKYMSGILDDAVYIVERDQEAFRLAIPYALDGICGDINDYEWEEKWKDVSFDSIIFADVLEHLLDPESVIHRASKLLKEDGKIFFSIPNIAHNDVLYKLYHDAFDYTQVGLLDESHIHFWGLQNIWNLASKIGMEITEICTTSCETGCTEQFHNREEFSVQIKEEPMLFNLLKSRAYGEVYQYIVTLEKKKEKSEKIQIQYQEPKRYSRLYMNTGNGFSEQESVRMEAERISGVSYMTMYMLKDTKKLQEIRIDPVEGQSCIITHVSVRQGKNELTVSYCDHAILKRGILLKGNDPWLQVSLIKENIPLSLEVGFILPGKEYFTMMEESLIDKERENRTLLAECESTRKGILSLEENLQRVRSAEMEVSRQYQEALKQRNQLSKENASLHKEVLSRSEAYAKLKREYVLSEDKVEELTSLNSKNLVMINELSSQKELAEKKYNEKEQELDLYCTLVHAKDNEMFQLEKNIADQEQHIKNQDQLIGTKDICIEEMRGEIQSLNGNISEKEQIICQALEKEEMLYVNIQLLDEEVSKRDTMIIERDREICNRDTEIRNRDQYILGIEKQQEEADKKIEELETLVNAYKSRKIVRWADHFMGMIRKLLKLVKA